ncbi:hypothetical protein ACLOJK_023191 [Asimina triloba]
MLRWEEKGLGVREESRSGDGSNSELKMGLTVRRRRRRREKVGDPTMEGWRWAIRQWKALLEAGSKLGRQKRGWRLRDVGLKADVPPMGGWRRGHERGTRRRWEKEGGEGATRVHQTIV